MQSTFTKKYVQSEIRAINKELRRRRRVLESYERRMAKVMKRFREEFARSKASK